MTTEFQKNLLRYLVQASDGNQYFQYLDSSIFDFTTYQVAFDILSKYFKKYGHLPTPVSALQLLDDELASTPNLPEGLADQMEALFREFNVPLHKNDLEYIQDSLANTLREKKTDQLIFDYGEQRLNLEQLSSKLNQLALIQKGGELPDVKGFLVQDRHHYSDDYVDVAPTFLHDLNALTTAGGFYSPQLIVFMSGPKHFKTGLLIKLAVEYARGGYQVYYADCENGKRAMRYRSKQAIIENTPEMDKKFGPLTEEEKEITLDNFNRYRGGDIFIDYYPADTTTVGDVRNRLFQIKEEVGMIPDIIFWDSIDGFLPTDPVDQKRDTRFQIRKVYNEAIALNNEIGSFAIAPSQVNRNAVSKKTFDMKDIAEDFGKIMNAHAVFALCATPEEIEEKIRRIVPVAQREGKRYAGVNQCIIYVDEEYMYISEVDKEKYLKDISDD